MATKSRLFAGLVKSIGGAARVKTGAVENMTTSTITLVDSAEVAIDTFDGTEIRSMKYLVTAQKQDNTAHQSTEILLTHDGDTATLTSYGTILHSDNNQTLAFYDARIDSNDTVSLLADPQGLGNLKFSVLKTSVKVL